MQTNACSQGVQRVLIKIFPWPQHCSCCRCLLLISSTMVLKSGSSKSHILLILLSERLPCATAALTAHYCWRVFHICLSSCLHISHAVNIHFVVRWFLSEIVNSLYIEPACLVDSMCMFFRFMLRTSVDDQRGFPASVPAAGFTPYFTHNHLPAESKWTFTCYNI